MEDRVHIECARKEDGSLDYIFAAVYDGHGGAQASEYTRENLLENIRTQKGFNSECDEEVLKAIKTGFLKTHDSMLKISETWPRTASGYSCTAGTTASCVFIRNCKIYVGHVGDSSVIMGYSDSETKEDCLKAKQLTVDHKPDNATELSRIQFAGGCVLPKSGISRVVWTRPIRGHRGPIRRSTPTEQIPFLAIARSLGDFWSYNDITEEFVVSPVPDVSVYNLTPADKCIFVVSDGVTNVMSSASIMKALHTSINNIEENEPSTSINPAHSVIKSVLESWSILRADNISIVCIMLEHANETSISANSIQEDLNTSIDLELTKNPTAMIKISKDTITSFSTEPVKLKYRGAIDKEATTLKYSGPGFVIVEREDEPVDEEERHFAKNRRNSIDDSQEVPHVSDAELEVTYEEGDEEEEEFDSPPLAAPFSSYDYPSSSNGYFQHNGTAKFHSEHYHEEYENMVHQQENGLTEVFWDAQKTFGWSHEEDRHIDFEDLSCNYVAEKNGDEVHISSTPTASDDSIKMSTNKPSSSTASNTSSLCASALSPIAMLQAIRASNEDIRRNSLIPQITRSKYIKSAAHQRTTPISSTSRKTPQKRPMTNTESTEPEQSEPPSKRSRFWNFITSMGFRVNIQSNSNPLSDNFWTPSGSKPGNRREMRFINASAHPERSRMFTRVHQYSTNEQVRVPNVIALVGLPARGKTYISYKLCRYLNWIGIKTRAFNVGEYRRQACDFEKEGKADFFDHSNERAVRIRDECAKHAMEDMGRYLDSKKGEVAVFDATNTTRPRRKMLLDFCNREDHETKFRLFFIESVCDDPDIIDSNITEVKVNSPDYKGRMTEEQAKQDFLQRIEKYSAQYAPLCEEKDAELSFIKVINAGRSFFVHNVNGHVQSRVVYFLMNIHLLPRSIYLTRHGESEYNKIGRLGGDSPLSENGVCYAHKLRKYFEKENIQDLRIWCSQKIRVAQTANHLKDLAAHVEYWKVLDEIDAGICEGLTYEDFEARYPKQFSERDKDKYHYRYPSGESYEDLVARLEPVIMELERQSNVLVISHQATIRCILAYFDNKKREELPYLNVPLHTVIKLTPKAYSCQIEMFKFKIDAVDTYRAKPTEELPWELNGTESNLCRSP